MVPFMKGDTRMKQIQVRCELLQVQFQQEADSEMEICLSFIRKDLSESLLGQREILKEAELGR